MEVADGQVVGQLLARLTGGIGVIRFQFGNVVAEIEFLVGPDGRRGIFIDLLFAKPPRLSEVANSVWTDALAFDET